MIRKIILITGGAKSGKSRYAEGLAAQLGERRVYVATAEPKDAEMVERIALHRGWRDEAWTTVEEPLRLTEALLALNGRADVVLVDCLTLWVSNLLLEKNERSANDRVDDLISALDQIAFHLIFVTNEVGWGIVPENPLARKFRDVAGSTNQRVAEAADQVFAMVSGIAVKLK
jgi:adenosylcobinamide kinase/adenosylcobinamide-phosphate guanylyltransferase